MGGAGDRENPEIPDYAGKDSGRSGGPGGHARDRLRELLEQRVPPTDRPVLPDEDQGDPADAPDDRPADEDSESAPDTPDDGHH